MKKSFVLFLLLVACMAGFAQLQTAPQWTSVLSDQPETFRTQLISSSENSVKVNVQVPGFFTTNVTTPRGEAKVITMPKAVSTAKAGEPEMPMTGIPAIIGDQARMNIRVLDAQYMDFEGIEVAPSKGDFSRQIDPATVPYTYGACYSQDAFFPASNVGLYEPYIIRDFRGQNMVIYPYAYNPVSKTLRVYYNMTVEMYKVDNHGSNVKETRRDNTIKMDPDFKSVYQRHFINYQTAMNRYTPVDEEGDLLIICYDNFISSMTDFVNWKKTRGVNTTIVGTSTAGSTYSAIQTYIRNQYNANNNLTHVLLVGDVAQIPGYSYSGGGSSYSGLGDNAYGQIVGSDYYNDIFIGRFSAQTAAQVTTQVNRVITYERDLTTSATWLQKADGIARNEGGSGHNGEDDYEHMDVIRTDLLNYGYSTVYQDYENLSGYTGTASSISSHINGGVGIVNYCNHGNTQLWGVASYSNTHVNNLTNSNKLPFIWSVACLVGKYDNTSTSYGSNYTIGQNNDCFAEAWMHATYSSSDLTPTGAIGALMSYISQPWIPPMWAQDECVDILAGLSSSGGTKHTWGGISINGLFGIFDNYGSDQSAVGTYQAWILYGDPSMLVRTKTPQDMTVTHPGTIAPGINSYNVTVNNGNGALATITDANHNILGRATVNGSTANITINGTLTVGSELTLCVFGFNKVTYLGTIQVVSADGPYITLDSYTPNIALVNQSTNLSLTFKNVGNAATSGTTTVTLTGDSNVTIGTGTKTFSSLAVNASTTVSGFSFTIKPTVTVGSNVTLHYSAVNGSNTWEGDLSVTANQVYTVTVASNNNNYGTVNGGGQYNYNQSCTVTATPADGYMFTSWTQDGNIVSTDAEYTFNVTSNVNLVANFASGVMIGSGTDTNENLPSNSYYNYTLSEQIYTKAELGSAGAITSIAFYNGGSAKTRTFDIYMKSTTKSSFSGSTDWISVSSSDKVFSGSVTMVAGDWTTITFTTPFVYDGNSNVVLVTDDNTGSYSQGMACRVFSASSQALYVRSDGTNYNPNSPSSYSGTVLSVKNQVILTKEPISTEPVNITVSASPAQAATVSGGGEYTFGQTCTVAATPNAGYTFTGWTENGNVVSAELSYSFTATADRNLVANFIQAVEIGTASSTNSYLPTYNYYNYSFTEQIYTAQEIGVAGTINGIAFYNEGTEKTRTLDLYVKATTKSTFSSKTDWVSMSNSDKVFSGSVTFTTGAWTFINFTTPFEYDGASNIIIAVDDNTGSYTNSPHMACSVFSASSQAIYIYSDGTNYTPSSPTTSQSSGGYDLLSVKNHILISIEANTASSYDVTVSANPANGGTVTGEGTYDAGATATLTATANEGYTFTNWTKNGTVVSSNATYSFTVNAANSGAYVANFTINSYTVTVTANPAEYGTVTLGIRNRDDLVYDFEDGWQGWTTFQGNTTSPNSWMHNTEYPTSNNDFTSGYGYNNSDGFMLSESYISGTSSGSGTAVTPDNYLVSPMVRLGGSVSFYAGARNTSYCAEKFSVMVSTTGNTDAASFTTVGTWTLSLSAAGYNDTPYTVDLSQYSGMGYIAIRHFDCYDQWFLAVDNITIVEGQEQSAGSGTFNYGETCVVTATPTGDYHFVNWTENGTPVSSDATYSFTVTGDRDLVANFAEQAVEVEQTVMLTQGWSWWSTNLDITLEELEDAIAAAVGTSGTATIKSKSGSITYSNGHWRESGSTTMTLDIRQMYKIQTSTACQITLTGVPVNPAAYEITVTPGNNWIGFPCGESMSVTEAFSGLNPADGDVIKGMNGNARYSNGNWRSQGLSILEPGQGYIYQSNATESKTFTYGMNAK